MNHFLLGAILLLLALGISFYTTLRAIPEYKKFANTNTNLERIKFYQHWILESWLYLGLFAVVALLLLNKKENIFRPIVYKNILQMLPDSMKNNSDALSGFLAGFAVGIVALIVITVIRVRQGNFKPPVLGEFGALLPRNNTEKIYAAGLAISAGINEELFFRAALPVLFFGFINNQSIAIALSILVFGLAHAYQGWKGVLQTAVAGWFLMRIFILTNNIFIPIAIHALIDLNSFLLVPALTGKIKDAVVKT